MGIKRQFDALLLCDVRCVGIDAKAINYDLNIQQMKCTDRHIKLKIHSMIIINAIARVPHLFTHSLPHNRNRLSIMCERKDIKLMDLFLLQIGSWKIVSPVT